MISITLQGSARILLLGLLPWATLCLIGNKIDLGEVNRKVSAMRSLLGFISFVWNDPFQMN